jgi:phospholipid/cholesterol/gamma-HCH transport system ATP-binding protein
MLVLENVQKALKGREVLKGIDLEVRRGETVVIIGQSGTGKSVTLKTIIGLMRPDAGKVVIDGEDVTGFGEKKYSEVRKKFGVLFQSGALINWLTIEDNVALPLREHTQLGESEILQKVEQKLRLLNLLDARTKMPSEISGGMRKRAGLARAIILDPKIILYDEPTSGLDPVMSNQINELILRMQKILGITSIVVTHDMESAYRIADRIAMLFDGRIVEVGSCDEIRNTQNPIVRQFIEGRTAGPITGA